MSLDLSNKTDELKQIEGIFPQNLMNDLVVNKLKETVKLQDIIKADELHYKSKADKFIILVNILYLLFLIDIHEGYLSLENVEIFYLYLN